MSRTEAQVDPRELERIIAQTGTKPDAVIPILQEVQRVHRYLPEDVLREVSAKTEIEPASLLGVSTFYDYFRHKPVGEHTVRVCHGTACHVKGAALTQEAIERHLHIAPGDDTDPQGKYTIEKVACLGCCTLAPVVEIDSQIFSGVIGDKVERMFDDFARHAATNGKPKQVAGKAQARQCELPSEGEVLICVDSCCAANGCADTYDALQRAAADRNLPVAVRTVGCVSMCHRTPMVELRIEGKEPIHYEHVDSDNADELLLEHFRPRNWTQRLSRGWSTLLDSFIGDRGDDDAPQRLDTQQSAVCAYMGGQKQIAMQHGGEFDPLDFDAFVEHDGFAAWRAIREKDIAPDKLIQTIEQSGLRGRGGGGFPVARKWQVVREAEGSPKYVICNGDEGDPGAFMDRMLLESFPYRVIEGLMLAAYAVGASEGVFYIRAEYPRAVERVTAALEQCRQRGILGTFPSPNGKPFTISLRQGAGAFVCGEETALIASLEGKRGMPTRKPPFPAQQGLWGKPTLVNNVETLALLPWIVREGGEVFAHIGTPTSTGTKVFALAGKVQRGGLIEVPMGITVRDVVEKIGGGPLPGRTFKAVQIGGPSGGCLPAQLADTPIDYEALRDAGAIMGSGGLVVLDNTDCMVDLARYFLRFTQDQSCGKCTFCRVGTRRMLDILDRICEGKGKPGDLQTLEELSEYVQRGSLCGLGATAPNPILTTLRYFRAEYEAHLDGRCPAGRCKALIRYEINNHCVGCTICAQQCPVDAIAVKPYELHVIDDELCTRCDACRTACPHNAVEIVSP